MRKSKVKSALAVLMIVSGMLAFPTNAFAASSGCRAGQQDYYVI